MRPVHVLFAVGSFDEWKSTSIQEWSQLLSRWVAPLSPPVNAKAALASRLTLAPYESTGILDRATRDAFIKILNVNSDQAKIVGQVAHVPVQVFDVASGAERLAAAGRTLAESTRRISERAIDQELLGEDGEPDLVVACGPAHQAIPSLVWELAYSEIVYLDIPWRSLQSGHIDHAIRDFHNRNRRFGGV
jgi:undecaprenyl diphosphate synthase